MVTIEALVDDLRPVKPVRPMHAGFLAAAATIGIAMLVSVFLGMRSDIAAGDPAQIVLVRSGVLFLLGFATLQALALSALPNVGVINSGWKWLLAAASVFPFLTLMSWWQQKPIFYVAAESPSRIMCVGMIVVSAVTIGSVLVFWLRRGAPVHVERTAWLLGLASGALGAFCFNLYCSSTSVEYVGLWYSTGILISAVAARVLVPPFIRW